MSSSNPSLRLKGLKLEPTKQDSPEANYKYQPLQSPNSFRILELLPLKDGEEIQVSMHHTPLDKAPAYQTLSYEWGVGGNAERRNPIRCDDGILKITDNLKNALRRLRFPTFRRHLWVDALCINQEDLDERGQQVGLMKDIYSFSHQTFIWLGEEGPYTSQAFQALKGDAKLSKEEPPARFEDPYEHAWYDWLYVRYPGQLYSERSKPLSEDTWTGLQDLFNRSYFGRMWIIQEVAHAQRAVVLCGAQEIDWTEFARGSGYSLSRETEYQSNFLSTIKSIEHLRKIERREADPLTFLEIIKSFPKSKATDPRDNIYSLLSLARDYRHIVPDYKLSTVNAFKRISDVFGSDHLALYSFYYPPCISTVEGLPSWVPDFSRPNPNREMISRIKRLDISMSSDMRGQYFQNTETTTPRWWNDETDNMLKVDNKWEQNFCFYGKVTRVSDVMSEDDLMLVLGDDETNSKEILEKAISALILAEGKKFVDANDYQGRQNYIMFKSLPASETADMGSLGKTFLSSTSATTELFKNKAGRQLFMLDSGLVGVGPEGNDIQIPIQIGDECAELKRHGRCILRADPTGVDTYTIRGPILWFKWMKTAKEVQPASQFILIR